MAIIFTSLVAAGLILEANLEALARTTVALLLIVFTIVNATVLWLRRDPVDHDHFQVPSVDPGARGRHLDRADDPGQGRGLGPGGHPAGHRRRALRDQLGGGA